MKIARKFAVAGGVTALVLGAGMGGLALADIPDSDDGEFHACVSNGGGQVRMIDKQGGASCHSYETEKVWTSGANAAASTVLATTDVTFTNPVTVDDDAVCPSTHPTVTGGGWKADPDTITPGDLNAFAVTENGPTLNVTGSQDAWHVEGRFGYAASLPGGAKITVYAVCAA